MEWTTGKAIYLQICDYVYDQIAKGLWQEGDRIVSVREMAAQISVNHNTVQRAYGQLVNCGIISAERGTGYFICPGARKAVDEIRKQEFRETIAPEFFKTAAGLELDVEELAQMYRGWLEVQR